MEYRELFKLINQHFTAEELKEICFDLGINYEDIRGTSKKDKARELVLYAMKKGLLSELEALCLKARPFAFTDSPPRPSPSPKPVPPRPLPPPPTDQDPQHNPYTLTKLLHIFFDEGEQTQLAERWGETYGRFHPSHKQPIHPLVEKLASQDQLAQLIDAAQHIHPELPWSEAYIAPGLVATPPPTHPDISKMSKLLSNTFPDRDAFDLFCASHFPQFLNDAPDNQSLNRICLELPQYLQRRGRLPELLTTMQANYPAEFKQHGPYERTEKPFEKQKRENKEKLAVQNEAQKVLVKEIINREATPPDRLILRQTLNVHAKRGIKSISWLPQEARLLSLTFNGDLQAWNMADDKAVANYKMSKNKSVSFAKSMPNGTEALLISGPLRRRKLCILKLENYKPKAFIDDVDDKVNTIAISPDSSWAVTAGDGNSLQVWNLTKAVKQTKWHGHLQPVTQVLMTSDGKQIISGSKDETIRIWDAAGELQHTLTEHTDEIAMLEVSPDGQYLASVQKNSMEIFIWKLPKPRGFLLSRFRKEKPQLVKKLPKQKSWINALSFSANGRFLATKSFDNKVRLWQTDTWKIAIEMMETLGGPVVFHPKRPLLATGGNNGKAIRIWQIVS